jgi:hypothetical protein
VIPVPAFNNVGLPVVCLQTAIIDLTVTAGAVPFTQNPPAGFYGCPVEGKIIVTSGSGTCTAGPTIAVGNNSTAFSNTLTPTTPSTANIQATITNAPAVAVLSSATGTLALPLADLVTPLKANVTGATGTGGFTLFGRILVTLTLHTPVP